MGNVRSYNEMGQFDIPAIINYVLKISGQDQLFYFGYVLSFKFN